MATCVYQDPDVIIEEESRWEPETLRKDYELEQEGEDHLDEICICHGYTFTCRIVLLEHQVAHFAERGRQAEREGNRWKEALLRRIDLGTKDLNAYVDWEDEQYGILLEERNQINQERQELNRDTELLTKRYHTYAEMVREREVSQQAVETRQRARAVLLQKIALELEVRQDFTLEE